MRWLAALALVTAFAGPETRHVVIRDLAFRPGTLSVTAGDTVAWTNDDIVPHTVTFDAQEGRDELQMGETLRIAVPSGDTLAYFCRYHPSMTGRLVVR